MTFQESIQSFIPTTPKDIMDKLGTGDKLVLFVGRASCPYCAYFAPRLAQVANDLKMQVYFIASDDLLYFEEINDFRQTYGMVTVPALLVQDAQGQQVFCDSRLPDEKLRELLA